jgi:hypothetical protein
MKSLVAKIREAFRETPPPSWEQICPKNDGESFQIKNFLDGLKWTEINITKLGTYVGQVSAIPFCLSAGAFHYYFPGFILSVLHSYDDLDMLAGALAAELTPSRNEDFDDYVKRFDVRQREVVHEVFCLFDDMNDSAPEFNNLSHALAEYWKADAASRQ